MSLYQPIFLQQSIEDNELEHLSESDILDFEKQARKIYPLLVTFLKASFMWPFWTGIKKYGPSILVAFYVAFFISTFLYVTRVKNNDELDVNIAMELCVQTCCACFVIFSMYILIIDKQGPITVQKLLIVMMRDLFQCSSEEKIFLQNYIDKSNFVSYISAGFICIFSAIYIIVIPLLWPLAANLILPGNHTYQKRFTIHLEFFIDADTQFYYNFFMISILCYIIPVFISSSLIAYVSEIFYLIGKFRFMGLKLKQICHFSQTQEYLEKDDEIFKHVSQLVQLHQFCIYYFDSLKKITGPVLVFGTLFVIICFSISGCAMVMEYKKDTNIALKMGLVYIMCIECLFFTSYPSQKIYDASSDICKYCYSTDWYRYSIKTRKMIQLIMIRSIRPCCVRIGPCQCLNYETSRQIIQLSLSYITALMSIYHH